MINTKYKRYLEKENGRTGEFKKVIKEKFSSLASLIRKFHNKNADFGYIAHYGYPEDLYREYDFLEKLPVSVAGLGLREAGSMYFFTKVGMSGEVALTIALLSFALIFLFGLSGGVIYVLTFSYRRLQRHQAS